MVITHASQLSTQCNKWLQTMRNYRQEIIELQQKLGSLATGAGLSKDILQSIEHYYNRFHIQLINIHDIKHAIKAQQQRITLDVNKYDEQVSDPTWAKQEQLNDEYQRLDYLLLELTYEFGQFTEGLNK
jgi:hypothetical protein